MTYKPTIGLEIHAELKTNSKMFCGCLNNPDEKRANFNVCPVCMAHPGTLPVINESAVEMVLKAGMALNCKLAEVSKFDRKNYFYPDLPKGYQISQFDKPLCENGYLDINGKKIRIRRIHLEEDTGRLMHPDGADPVKSQGDHGASYSLVDYNRAGVPLMELVTEPDIENGKEARLFAEQLQLIFRYLGISSADMEKGQMRVEVNISISKDDKLGTKVEIKNLNSFKVVEKSVDFELRRQEEALENGEKIAQETRGWHDKKEITFSQREKEEAHDYRYFPEPDLPTLYFKNELFDKLKGEMPELPESKRKRFKDEYELDEKNIEIFVNNKDLGEYFEKSASELKTFREDDKDFTEENYKKALKISANYLITDISGLLKGDSIMGEKFVITPENFAEFVFLIERGKISSKIAKQVLLEMYKTGADPSHIIEEQDLSQMESGDELESIIKEVMQKNPKAIEDYKNGKQNSIQFLAGQVMAATRGRAEPNKVQELLRQNIDK